MGFMTHKINHTNRKPNKTKYIPLINCDVLASHKLYGLGPPPFTYFSHCDCLLIITTWGGRLRSYWPCYCTHPWRNYKPVYRVLSIQHAPGMYSSSYDCHTITSVFQILKKTHYQSSRQLAWLFYLAQLPVNTLFLTCSGLSMVSFALLNTIPSPLNHNPLTLRYLFSHRTGLLREILTHLSFIYQRIFHTFFASLSISQIDLFDSYLPKWFLLEHF